MRFPFLLFFILAGQVLTAQFTGRILDAATGEELPFVSVYVKNSTKGVSANASGAFRLPLDPGTYEVIFQYVGYKQHVENVTIGNKPVSRTIRLEANILELGEVVITSEDPAMRIMREVIAKRTYFRDRIGDYTCDVYIKGFHKLVEAPKKIMGQEIKMEDVIEENGTSVLYLSESVSQLMVQQHPPRQKEVMISSKISGKDNGFSLNRTTFTDFNLYNEHINIERDLLSPLADNAFNYYRFVLEGKYKDGNGYDIYKIKVEPKRSADPVFGGWLYIVDGYWNLAGVDLYCTGAAIKQPILDTLSFRQEFVPIERPDRWCLISQLTTFKFEVLGFKIRGFFNTVFSGYNLHPNFKPDQFDREVFKIAEIANTRDTAYWAATRPVPLTQEEERDYVVKDSIWEIKDSKPYKDSLDRRGNRFKPFDLVTGYTWRNTWKQTSVNLPGAYQWIQFNTVQGWVLNVQPQWTHSEGKNKARSTEVEATINYGFSEQQLRGGLRVKRRLESIHNTDIAASGGLLTEQFDGQRPISVLANGWNSLVFQKNFMKLYEKAFVQVGYTRNVATGLRLDLGASYEDRRPLVNTADLTWYKGTDRTYWPNVPLFRNTTGFTGDFERSSATIISAEARIRFREQYETYPDKRNFTASGLPELRFTYKQALPVAGALRADWALIRGEIYQEHLAAGLFGYTEWSLSGGSFLRKKTVPFMDYYHPLADETLLGKPSRYQKGFMLMPYYVRSTTDAFAEAHLQHHLQGWLLDKIPGIRRLNWKEVVSVNAFYANTTLETGKKPVPYWELAFGFEHIGFKIVRPLRVDIAASFDGGKWVQTGLRIGVEL